MPVSRGAALLLLQVKYALWPSAVQMRRESYDASRVVDECKLRDPHLPYLAHVLVRT